MSEIAADILNKAAEHVESMPNRPPFKADMLNAIAKAIIEERERCANIAENIPISELISTSATRVDHKLTFLTGGMAQRDAIVKAILEHPNP